MDEQKRHNVSKTLTIMFIDLVEYTTKTQTLTREEFHHLHDLFDDITKTTLKKFKGKIVKKIGDAYLFYFESPTDAVHCGVELQKRFHAYNEEHLENPINIRASLDQGEVIMRDGDIYGSSVNLASRIESITPPKHIYFSEAVQDAMNKNEIPYMDMGYHEFKGFDEPKRVFRVTWDYETPKWYQHTSVHMAAAFVAIIIVVFIVKKVFF